ncbi:MAG TPA: N-acetyl-gamma-glutamyl-phosphate reductase [Candidatus Atribacteria bacterium]|jgi:N-acetyl-gamma-glutamyl-phosphate reductase|nr:MAG: N-acetyl-gamma-glutamyl-phosphate reductase [Atribacteria bacterium 34_128]HAJ33653.1 N-acetyl-gamma-glutamyl-phosphate reductase [Candidatus Atribacteria bacterium]
MKKIKVSVIGSTGYTGKELVKILMNHQRVKLVHLISSSYAGKNIVEVFPEFLNKLDKKLIKLDLDVVSQDSDLVFTALPHTVSMDVVPELLKKGVKVVDLSADYRLKNPTVYKEWYKKEHNQVSKELLTNAVYGLPEIYSDKIKDASLVANPGCYPTSVILGIAPLLKYHLVEPEGIIIDSKSGTTGAGRKLSLGLHFSECNENFKAYKVIKHNHLPEVEQELSYIHFNGKDNKKQGTEIKVCFTPHLLPINRGILSTCYLTLKESKEEEEILEVYQKFYQKAPFVRIFEPSNLPEIKFVAGTNYCDIGFSIDERVGKIKVISAIDNLLKGAAGQAVQNMNIMSGFKEVEGLNF